MIQFQNPERFVSVSFPDSFVSLDYKGKLADLTTRLLAQRAGESARFQMPTSDLKFLARNHKLQLFTRFLTGRAICLSLSFEHQRSCLVLTSNDIFPVAQYQLLRRLEGLSLPNVTAAQFKEVRELIITNLFVEIYKQLAICIAKHPVIKNPTKISLPAEVSLAELTAFIVKFNDLLQKIRSTATTSPSYFAEINAILPCFEQLANYHHRLSECVWWNITDFQASLPSLILQVDDFIDSFRKPTAESDWRFLQKLISTGQWCCPLLNPACEKQTTCHGRSSPIHCPVCQENAAPTSECLWQFCDLYNSESQTVACNKCRQFYFYHAEMKRLMIFFHDHHTSDPRNDSASQLSNPDRILRLRSLCFVINRFTCYSCQKVFNAFNEYAQAEGHRLTCETAGTHGIIFSKWTAPLAGCLDLSNRFFADNGLLQLYHIFENLIEADSQKMLLGEEAQKTMISQVVVAI